MGLQIEEEAQCAIRRIGIVGTGVMGSMLTLLFAEHADVEVMIFDLSEANMQAAIQKASKAGLSHKVKTCASVSTLCQSLTSPRVLLFSLPHGKPGDSVVQSLTPHLSPGDIIVDGSNEDYRVTQKRQGWVQSRGVSYVGMGVSGGFAGARNGPSLMPGGDERALDLLMPLLRRVAARDDRGRECVAKIGPGGSGHYVKMVHNGIEHGVMSVLCEAWAVMNDCLGMDGDAIGEIFEGWNQVGGLRDNFLVAISGPICRTRHINGKDHLLHQIRDTVVQDANDSEGTGVWANLEAISRHVPAPSLTTAHYLRIASANHDQRVSISKTLGTAIPSCIGLSAAQKEEFLEDLHRAVYGAVLSCFVQGLDLLTCASAKEGWNIKAHEVVRIWRAGCIIKSDALTDLFERHYTKDSGQHPFAGDEIANEIKPCLPALKSIVLQSIGADACVPALSATLEYLKYSGSTNLPTSFVEAQLDAFGAHGYQLKSEPYESLSKGKYHNSWSQPV